MKKNKVGITDLKNIIKENKIEEKSLIYKYGDSEITVTIKPHLTLSEYGALVKAIADSVFTTNEHGSVEYHPYLTRVAEVYAALAFYTDLTDKLNADLVWSLYSQTDFTSRIFEQIDSHELSMAFADARELIKHKREALYQRSGLSQALENLVNTINEKVSTELDWNSLKTAVEKLGQIPDINSPEFVKEILKARQDINGENNEGATGGIEIVPK